MKRIITVNGRHYNWPSAPTVVVCIDGCEWNYISGATKAGVAPFFQRLISGDLCALRANCVIPSFTNPNNMSIITGVPPSVHGICGNYLYDRQSNSEVLMNDPKWLKVPTILATFADAGAKVAAITAKDKLRLLLGHKLHGICFSSEKADIATIAENGIDNVLSLVDRPLPDVYSGDLSEFVFAAGVKLVETRRPDLLYLSTTDYIQHKFPPGSTGANDFYAMMDGYLSKLDQLGCVITVTADHGMNAKHDDITKQPNVIYLQDECDKWLGKTLEKGGARIILPITDPYVVHHGALGSFATIYLQSEDDKALVRRQLEVMNEIEMVLDNAQAAIRFELPAQLLGDLVVISTKHFTLGTSKNRHDLSGLTVPLRSHGGITEQTVPLLVNRQCHVTSTNPRNFDAFYIALNLTL